MDDETKQNAEDVTAEDKSTVTQQDKSAKTFTQEELDRQIKERLGRQKSSFDKEKETWDTEKTTYQTDLQFYEEQLGKVIDAQTSDWDAVTRDLFNSLSVKERMEKLADEKFVAQVRRKNTIPETPKSNKDHSNLPAKVVPFGGR